MSYPQAFAAVLVALTGTELLFIIKERLTKGLEK